MKNFEKLILETKNDFDILNIDYRTVTNWSINTRAKKRWGLCKRKSFDTFEISISSLLLQDGIDDQLAKNVIAHELLHTVKGCFAHKGKWKMLAEKINSSMPNYSIRVRDDFSEINVPIKNKTPKYIIKCSKCDFYCLRYKRSKVIEKPEHYRCPKCNGKLIIENYK